MVKVPVLAGNFISAMNFPVGSTISVEVTGEGYIREQEYQGKKYMQTVIPIRYLKDGVTTETNFSLTSSNASMIIRVLGDETKNWVGHRLSLLVVPNERAGCKKGLAVVKVE